MGLSSSVVILTIVLLLLATKGASSPSSTSTSFIRVDRDTLQYYSTSDGRHKVFHGLAHTNNGQDPDYRLWTMSDTQMEIMRSWGLNVVRQGFHWHKIEPYPGVYNTSYLDELETLVQKYNSHGIYVVLDMHQDCWSTLFCNLHGVPKFYATPKNSSEYYVNGSKAYPEPIAAPQYAGSMDPQSLPFGEVDSTACENVGKGPMGWASCYPTYAMSSAAQQLYDNAAADATVARNITRGLMERYGDMWVAVATRMAKYPNILGYELINEPWLGEVPLSLSEIDPITNPEFWDLWLPGVSDRRNLHNFYKYLHKRIREVDDEHIIFFEPATGGNILDMFPVGFSEGPGGDAYNDRQVLSYHIYCPIVQVDMPHPHHKLSPLLKWLETQLKLGVCDLLNDAQYDVRQSDCMRLGVGGFMTEFGAVQNDTVGIDVLNFAMEKMDSFGHGWTYWYTEPESAPDNIVRTLSRTYATAIAGDVVSMKFDHYTAAFTLVFRPSADPQVFELDTEIFVSNLFYPSGVSVTSSSPECVSTTHDAERQTVFVRLSSSCFPLSLVHVTISPTST